MEPGSRPAEAANARLREANRLYAAGKLVEAARIYRGLLDQFPKKPFLLNRVAEFALGQNNFSTAAELLRRSLEIMPQQPIAWMWLGRALAKMQDVAGALQAFDRVIVTKPDLAHAHADKGALLAEQGRTAEALECLDRAIALQPELVRAICYRAGALKRLDRYEDAIAAFRRAIEIEPNQPGPRVALAILLSDLARPDEALAAFDAAIEADSRFAEARASKAELLLLMGDYLRGWKLYPSRRDSPLREQHLKLPQFAGLPMWSGDEAVGGKTIVLRPEVGLGDFIMFVRYVPLVQKLGAKVLLYTPRPLAALFESLGPEVRVVPDGEQLPGRVDLQCSIMDLPRVFATTKETVPAEFPYLWARTDKQAAWREKLGQKTRPRVGLVWSGKGDRNIDSSALRRRSIPFQALRPLLDGLPLEFHSLQKEFVPAEEAAVAGTANLALHHLELSDMSDTAALIAEMDLVVSIDTSVAHLAGAMGKPVWVMLPFASDYRWAIGARTPWYPGAQLFRQSNPGDWPGVVREVAERLGARFGSAGSSRSSGG